MTYIKLYSKVVINDSVKQSIFIRTIIRFISFILPATNPDYDSIIDEVAYWYLEFEEEYEPPMREIGFNSSNLPILKMPYRSNYGYWVDNNLTLNDFKGDFKLEEITINVFEDAWNNFKKS